MPNNMPTVLRRLGVRIRLERNNLVLLELSGEIDFETELEQRLRTAASSTDSLQLTNASGNDNPEDGVVDFKIIYTYNTATSEYGITLSLGSHPEDKDGLLHMNNPGGSGSSTFKNIFGALLVFAPIINASAVSAANDSESAGNWIALGASLAAPVAIGGLNIFRTRRAILYGGELIVKFSEPDPAAPQSVDVGIVFDYGVEFDIVIQSLGIGVDRDVPNPTAPPLKVRYKAIGFNLHYDSVSNGMTYTAVFDASKGYDLQLSDPSLFSLPAPLGNLFAVSAARLGRVNPLTLEIDLAIKVDLGIITVDKFKIKIPLESDGNVQIMPSGVKVNIPGTLVGSGFVEIVDTDVVQADGSTIHAKGIEGGVDLTVVPVKLRVAGNLAVTQLRNNDTGREGVGSFCRPPGGVSITYCTGRFRIRIIRHHGALCHALPAPGVRYRPAYRSHRPCPQMAGQSGRRSDQIEKQQQRKALGAEFRSLGFRSRGHSRDHGYRVYSQLPGDVHPGASRTPYPDYDQDEVHQR
jgi:hypothetical protein